MDNIKKKKIKAKYAGMLIEEVFKKFNRGSENLSANPRRESKLELRYVIMHSYSK